MEKGVTDTEAAKLAVMDSLIQLPESARLADLEPLVDKFPTDQRALIPLGALAHQGCGRFCRKIIRPEPETSTVCGP